MKILACPFCGGEPESGKVLRPGEPGELFAVECPSDLSDCDANPGVTGYTLDEAIGKWNRRAELPHHPLQPMVDAERAELNRYRQAATLAGQVAPVGHMTVDGRDILWRFGVLPLPPGQPLYGHPPEDRGLQTGRREWAVRTLLGEGWRWEGGQWKRPVRTL